MLEFCGKRFQVYKRAHKTCDTVFPVRGRRVHRAVHLETRCSGAAHDGCQAGCLIFWKEAWLKRVRDNSIAAGVARVAKSEQTSTPADESKVWAHAVKHNASGGPPTYVCQATRLPYATTALAWWDIRQYAEDYLSGNVRLPQLLAGFLHHLLQPNSGGYRGGATDALAV